MNLTSLLTIVHLIGLALGMGAATVKLVMLVQSSRDPALVPLFLRMSKLLTRHIILGLVLLTLSGIGWVLVGYALKGLLVVKVALVAAIWVLGPVIDNVVEPRFVKLAPAAGEAASPAFVAVTRQYVAIETVATLLFYAIVVLWVRA